MCRIARRASLVEYQVRAPTRVSSLAPSRIRVVAYRRPATLLWQREWFEEHSYMKTARITVGAMIVVAAVALGMSLGDSVLAQGGGGRGGGRGRAAGPPTSTTPPAGVTPLPVD